jgi:hypothetical protein
VVSILNLNHSCTRAPDPSAPSHHARLLLFARLRSRLTKLKTALERAAACMVASFPQAKLTQEDMCTVTRDYHTTFRNATGVPVKVRTRKLKACHPKCRKLDRDAEDSDDQVRQSTQHVV